MNDAIKALRTLANLNLAAGFRAEPTDSPEIVAEMTKMVEDDSAAFCVVAAYLEQGDVEAAQTALDGMDTSPRERAYEALEAAGAVSYPV